ncbi:FUSC family protein [Streptomyces sp. NPDC097619]|uniref:FUSC family protein n=1 Tax=Streptomyces sp. NPDC097619 TaxID=3157228 RepID=UPI0033282547
MARSAEHSAAVLRGTAAPGAADPELAALRARVVLSGSRTGAGDGDGEPAVLRRRAALIELADAALVLADAVELAVRGRAAAADLPAGRFWYARMRAPQLWWRRLMGHAGSRSVFFQNAVRISLALAAARAVAGLATLPHGFWAMLATLTLTRTTLGATRTSIRQALTGTLIGALCTAGVLALVGTDTTVYAAVMPPLLLITFMVGPVKGVGWSQALFALVVALVFAQLAPATWKLAEVRLLDVVVGSAVGVVFGLLAWPRGARAEVRRSGAVLMRSAAETVMATAAVITTGGVRDPEAPLSFGALRRALVLAESAFAQSQSEPVDRTEVAAAAAAGKGAEDASGGGAGDAVADGSERGSAHGAEATRAASSRAAGAASGAGGAGAGRDGGVLPAVDWQAVLMAGHHALWGAERVLVPPAAAGVPAEPLVVPALEPVAAEAVVRLSERVAGRLLLISAALDPVGDTPYVRPAWADTAGAVTGSEPLPPGVPGSCYTAAAWLGSLTEDLERIEAPDRRKP